MKNQTKPPPKSAEIRLSFFISGEIIKIFHNTCIIFLLSLHFTQNFILLTWKAAVLGSLLTPATNWHPATKLLNIFIWPKLAKIEFTLWPIILAHHKTYWHCVTNSFKYLFILIFKSLLNILIFLNTLKKYLEIFQFPFIFI